MKNNAISPPAPVCISVQQLTAHLETAGTLTFEVLPEPFFREGHIRGALLLDPDDVVPHARAQGATADRPIVVYCTGPSCSNSHRAAAELQAAGYTNVSVFADGKEGWRAAGRALEVSDAR